MTLDVGNGVVTLFEIAGQDHGRPAIGRADAEIVWHEFVAVLEPDPAPGDAASRCGQWRSAGLDVVRRYEAQCAICDEPDVLNIRGGNLCSRGHTRLKQSLVVLDEQHAMICDDALYRLGRVVDRDQFCREPA